MNHLFKISCVLVSLSFSLSAQDMIIKRNGDEIKSQVEEISDKEIKYKKFDNLEGPSYSISKSEVFIIKYSNGTKEVISNNTSTPIQDNKPSNSNSQTTYSAPPSTPASLRIEGEGWKYYQEGRRLSESSLLRILKESKNESAIKELEAGKSLKTAGTVLTAVGLPFLISGPIVAVIGALVIGVYNTQVDSYNNSSSYLYSSSTPPNESTYNTGNTMMGVGYGLFGTGLTSMITGAVLKGSSKKRYLKATEIYNAKL